MRRLRAAPYSPQDVKDATFVLISHAHLDHCDPDTLRPIASQCGGCRFVGSYEVADILVNRLGIEPSRVVTAAHSPIELGSSAILHPIPAAHRVLALDAAGNPRYLGFLIATADRRIYHAGDTTVHPAAVAKLLSHGRIDTALLPVNECNYYRARRGIVGNMSVREAFGYAEEIGAERVVPMHFDMFAPNAVYEEEILLIYRRLQPPFALLMPSEVSNW